MNNDFTIGHYYVEGDNKDIQKLSNLFDSLIKEPYRYVETTLGDLREALELETNESKYLSSVVNDWELDDDTTFYFSSEYAWAVNDIVEIIETAFPKTKIYFMVEDLGNKEIITNDVEGKHFKERYYAECQFDDGTDEGFFDTEDEALNYLCKSLGIECSKSSLAKWKLANGDGDTYATYYPILVV